MKNLWPIALFLLLAAPIAGQTSEVPGTSGNAFLRLCSGAEKEDMEADFRLVLCLG